jgi:hypothetical protein
MGELRDLVDRGADIRRRSVRGSEVHFAADAVADAREKVLAALLGLSLLPRRRSQYERADERNGSNNECYDDESHSS